MKWRMQTIGLVVLVAVGMSVGLGASPPTPTLPPSTGGGGNEDTQAQRDARMAWWREARFGMFIHWGVYSVPAGTYEGKQIPGIGEWIMNNASIPLATYGGYAKDFNPTKFNADEWVSIAKNAGMKYIVITSKHHDGFAMFHSKASSYNIYDATPFKRDPLAELAEACAKQGMKLGFYYSQSQDWGHPGGAAIRRDGRTADHWDPGQDGSYDDYLKTVALPQVREILTNYGPVAVLWFDTPVNMNKQRAQPFVDLLHELQPGIVWNNRLGGGFAGDTETPEQYVPPTGFPGRDWETCMTINNTWGYKSYDTSFKSSDVLLRNLIDIASKGGNYLLNVGPTSEGVIPQPEVDRLAQIGEWLKVNGDAIYGTTASPFKRTLEFGRATQKPFDAAQGRPGKIFLHVFDWPKDGVLWVPVSSKIAKAYLMAAPDVALPVAGVDGGAAITVNAAVADGATTVVVVELAEPLVTFVPAIRPGVDGTFTLSAADATITGNTPKLTTKKRAAITSWTNIHDTVQWQIQVTMAGKFHVQMKYSCDPASAGAGFDIVGGDGKISNTVTATKNVDDYVAVPVGEMSFGAAGPATILVQPTKGSGTVMNLAEIKLVPE